MKELLLEFIDEYGNDPRYFYNIINELKGFPEIIVDWLNGENVINSNIYDVIVRGVFKTLPYKYRYYYFMKSFFFRQNRNFEIFFPFIGEGIVPSNDAEEYPLFLDTFKKNYEYLTNIPEQMLSFFTIEILSDVYVRDEKKEKLKKLRDIWGNSFYEEFPIINKMLYGDDWQDRIEKDDIKTLLKNTKLVKIALMLIRKYDMFDLLDTIEESSFMVYLSFMDYPDDIIIRNLERRIKEVPNKDVFDFIVFNALPLLDKLAKEGKDVWSYIDNEYKKGVFEEIVEKVYAKHNGKTNDIYIPYNNSAADIIFSFYLNRGTMYEKDMHHWKNNSKIQRYFFMYSHMFDKEVLDKIITPKTGLYIRLEEFIIKYIREGEEIADIFEYVVKMERIVASDNMFLIKDTGNWRDLENIYYLHLRLLILYMVYKDFLKSFVLDGIKNIFNVVKFNPYPIYKSLFSESTNILYNEFLKEKVVDYCKEKGGKDVKYYG